MSYDPNDSLSQSSSLISVHQDLRSFQNPFIFDAPSSPQPSFLSNSDSYFEIGTSGGITIDPGLEYLPGQTINIYKNASNYQVSSVMSYDSPTGSLTFGEPSQIIGDSGTTGFNWIVNLAEDPFYGTDNNTYKIWTGPIYLSNIRLFNSMIDIDVQSTVLNQNVVRDEQNSILIDNCKPLLGAPKFARNR
jgi:hypothetical protein